MTLWRGLLVGWGVGFVRWRVGRTYAETGDLDAVFAKMRGAHEQVGGWLEPW